MSFLTGLLRECSSKAVKVVTHTFTRGRKRTVAMDIELVEKAIKSSVEEALKRMRQADAQLTKAQQGVRGERNIQLAEALAEYNRCLAELTEYLSVSNRHRHTDT